MRNININSMLLFEKHHQVPLKWLCMRLYVLMSPVAQWLEHPAKSQRVVSSNPTWNSNFSQLILFLRLIFLVFVTLCPLSPKLPGTMKFNYIPNIDYILNKKKKLFCISPY